MAPTGYSVSDYVTDSTTMKPTRDQLTNESPSITETGVDGGNPLLPKTEKPGTEFRSGEILIPTIQMNTSHMTTTTTTTTTTGPIRSTASTGVRGGTTTPVFGPSTPNTQVTESTKGPVEKSSRSQTAAVAGGVAAGMLFTTMNPWVVEVLRIYHVRLCVRVKRAVHVIYDYHVIYYNSSSEH